jgi:hypothetical protein
MIVTGKFSVLGYVKVGKEPDRSWECEELGLGGSIKFSKYT